MLASLWMRFLYLGLVGKMVAVIALLYGTGSLVGTLGWNAACTQLASVALFVLAVLLTALVIRWIWSSYTGKPGQ